MQIETLLFVLASYRTYGAMLELQSQDLRLLPAETEDFLVKRMGLNLGADEIRQLQTQLEGWIAGLQLELWLRQSRLRTAITWADEQLQNNAPQKQPQSEVVQLAIARVLLVKGDEPALAHVLRSMRRLFSAAAEEGRMGIQIEALALQALAYAQRGETASAMVQLEQALRLAEPERYIRNFANLGLPMARD